MKLEELFTAGITSWVGSFLSTPSLYFPSLSVASK